MKQIWKFTIDEPLSKIEMPVGGKVLCVQVQHSTPCLWVEIEVGASKETRFFVVYGTGHEMSGATNEQYIGTFQMDGGASVFHVYERV